MDRRVAQEIATFLRRGMVRGSWDREAFRRALGLRSQRTLTFILDGRARLPLELVEPVAQLLQLDAHEERQLLILSLAQDAPTSFINYLGTQLTPVDYDIENIDEIRKEDSASSRIPEPAEEDDTVLKLKMELSVKLKYPVSFP